MSGLNRWQGIVRLGADGELRATQSGKSVLGLRVACTEKYRGQDGQDKETTTWVNCSVWGARGEGLARVLVKGMLLYIEGPLRISSYDDKDNVKRTRVEIDVRELEILGRAKGQGDAAGDQHGGDAGQGGGGGGYNRGAPPAASGGGGYGGGYSRSRPAGAPAGASGPAVSAAQPPPPAEDYGGGGGAPGDDEIPF